MLFNVERPTCARTELETAAHGWTCLKLQYTLCKRSIYTRLKNIKNVKV